MKGFVLKALSSKGNKAVWKCRSAKLPYEILEGKPRLAIRFEFDERLQKVVKPGDATNMISSLMKFFKCKQGRDYEIEEYENE